MLNRCMSRGASLFAAVALMCAPLGAQGLRATRVASGIDVPTHLCSPPGDTSRLFVTSAPFGIRIIENGVLLQDRFLDLQGQLIFQGVGSMAFHPDFAQNGRFFVVLFENGFSNRLVEYRVSATNPNRADPASAVTILGPVTQTSETHSWNHVQFGPDGMLYLSTGDGLLDDPVQNPSQDLGSLAGKLLRLDVDAPAPYVPADNPFVGVPGARPEVFAYGLRNPWRFHIDHATETLYVADVGDIGNAAREELSVLPLAAARGANFGWKCFEGTLCRNFPGCPAGCGNGPNWVTPSFEFAHGGGRCAVIGGVTYDGPLPYLKGQYFFAEWCSGTIWSAVWDGVSLSAPVNRTQELAPGGGLRIDLPNAFGTDANGTLYILDDAGGEVYRIDDVCQPVTSTCVTSMNSVGFGAVISTAGSTSLAANQLRLVVDAAPPGTAGSFFYGFAPTLVPFGNGALCVAPPHRRVPVLVPVDANGHAELPLDLPMLSAPHGQGGLAPGVSAHFQFWFRDVAAGGAMYNTSNAVRVPFCL